MHLRGMRITDIARVLSCLRHSLVGLDGAPDVIIRVAQRLRSPSPYTYQQYCLSISFSRYSWTPQALSTHPNASISVSYLFFIFSRHPLHQHPPISQNPTSCLISSSMFLALITSRWMRKLGKEPVMLKLNDVFGSQDACRSGFIVDV